MNKDNFLSLIKEETKGMSPKEELKFYYECKERYNLLFKELIEEHGKKYDQCPKCKEYFSVNEKIEHVGRQESEVECVYQDAGYGDDDEFATVTRHNIYSICPLCGKEMRREFSTIISTKDRHDRYGNRF